jgi:hypothetical protein
MATLRRVESRRAAAIAVNYSMDCISSVPPAIVNVLSTNMPRLLQLYNAWDTDHNGTISLTEFGRALEAIGVQHTEDDIRSLFRVLRKGSSPSALAEATSDEDESADVTLEDLLRLKAKLDEQRSIATMSGVSQLRVYDEDAKSRHRERAALGRSVSCHRTLLRGLLGALWKSELRPHMALELVEGNAAQHDENGSARGPLKFHTVQQFVDDARRRLEACADGTTDAVERLLGEIRRTDLKLEEVRLTTKKNVFPSERGELYRLQTLLKAMAHDAEMASISFTRFCPRREDGRARTEGAFGRGIQRYSEAFLPRRDRRSVGRFSKAGMAVFSLLVVLVLLRRALSDSADAVLFACERLKHACDTLSAAEPPQLACAFNQTSVPFVADPAAFETFPGETPDPATGLLVLQPCSLEQVERMPRAMSLSVLVPLLLLCVSMPIGIFWRNTNMIIVRKLLLWTPTVPIVLVQQALRSAVLTTTLTSAVDVTSAAISIVEAWGLFVQVAVFLFMDAMELRMPKLRIVYALSLSLAFLFSIYKRSASVVYEEQWPLLPQDMHVRGLGSASRQSFILSIDYATFSLLLSGVLSVLFEPTALAVVKLRCDKLGYLNWRDSYLGKIAVRAHRRDHEVSDRVGRVRAKLHRMRTRTFKRSSSSQINLRSSSRSLSSSCQAGGYAGQRGVVAAAEAVHVSCTPSAHDVSSA